MHLFFWLDYFLDSRAEICQIFRWFLGKSNISKRHSEINWPLVGPNKQDFCSNSHQNLHWKLGQQSAICWNSLCLFRDYGLYRIFFRNKTFLFFKIESWNFQDLFKQELRETSQNFKLIRQEISWKTKKF